MTVVFQPHEAWDVSDGAPAGVFFDITVESASEPGKKYRIVREEASAGLTPYIIHTPACKAWRSGHRMCWHVLRALEVTEDPLRRFALDVREAWPLVCMASDLEVFRDFAAAMVQSAEQAINAAEELDRYEDRLHQRTLDARRSPRELRAAADAAIADFGSPDPRQRVA